MKSGPKAKGGRADSPPASRGRRPGVGEWAGRAAWAAALGVSIGLTGLVAVFAVADCDLPLVLRCLGGCPTYAEVAEAHLGAPETRCADADGRMQRVVLVDVHDRHWFDAEGALASLQVDSTERGAFCGGSRATRWFGPERTCR